MILMGKKEEEASLNIYIVFKIPFQEIQLLLKSWNQSKLS